MSLRKRLRDQAAKELQVIVDGLRESAMMVAKVRGLNTDDFLRIAAGGRTDSITAKAITDMANHKERELERIYNNQKGLPIEEPVKGKSK